LARFNLSIKRQSTIPDLVTAGKDTVAVRVPNHPVTLALLEQLNFPLAAQVQIPLAQLVLRAEHVVNYFTSPLTVF
jgi:L-threonylcarbamoyladenylate synthase